jgi:uncharacterized protein
VAGEDAIDYPALVARALRGVVRDALLQAARDGLPGEHHFYITFRTQAEGVVVPKRLASRYPEEMTVVLQNQFWALEVTPESFSVSLRFGGSLERLTVPFEAVTAFADPAAQMVLRFDGARPEALPPEGEASEAPAAESTPGEDAPKVVDISAFKRKP